MQRHISKSRGGESDALSVALLSSRLKGRGIVLRRCYNSAALISVCAFFVLEAFKKSATSRAVDVIDDSEGDPGGG